jgi:hypothetical protein
MEPSHLSLRPVGMPGPVTAAADFNGDGKLDLVAGDAVFAGNGDGTFRFPYSRVLLLHSAMRHLPLTA